MIDQIKNSKVCAHLSATFLTQKSAICKHNSINATSLICNSNYDCCNIKSKKGIQSFKRYLLRLFGLFPGKCGIQGVNSIQMCEGHSLPITCCSSLSKVSLSFHLLLFWACVMQGRLHWSQHHSYATVKEMVSFEFSARKPVSHSASLCVCVNRLMG